MESILMFDKSIQQTLKLITTCRQHQYQYQHQHQYQRQHQIKKEHIHRPTSILGRLGRNRSSSLPKVNLYLDMPKTYFTDNNYLYEYV